MDDEVTPGEDPTTGEQNTQAAAAAAEAALPLFVTEEGQDQAQQQPQPGRPIWNEAGRDMSKTGSICCFSKHTISKAFECILSCTTYTSLIYIILLIYCLASGINLDLIFLLIGYISLFSVVTTPLGLYGSNKASYCALFTFLFLASYHLYGLVMYFWFNLKAPSFTVSGQDNPKWIGYERLHFITSGSYTALVSFSIILATCKIVSLVDQIEPARVIVVDNSSDQ